MLCGAQNIYNTAILPATKRLVYIMGLNKSTSYVVSQEVSQLPSENPPLVYTFQGQFEDKLYDHQGIMISSPNYMIFKTMYFRNLEIFYNSQSAFMIPSSACRDLQTNVGSHCFLGTDWNRNQ